MTFARLSFQKFSKTYRAVNLRTLLKAEACSEPGQTSKMELFAKINND